MFLKKHQAYNAFRRNLTTRNRTLNESIEYTVPYFFIVYGFTWPPHNEHEPEWVDLHHKWTRLVRDLNIDNLRKM